MCADEEDVVGLPDLPLRPQRPAFRRVSYDEGIQLNIKKVPAESLRQLEDLSHVIFRVVCITYEDSRHLVASGRSLAGIEGSHIRRHITTMHLLSLRTIVNAAPLWCRAPWPEGEADARQPPERGKRVPNFRTGWATPGAATAPRRHRGGVAGHTPRSISWSTNAAMFQASSAPRWWCPSRGSPAISRAWAIPGRRRSPYASVKMVLALK